MCRICRPQGEMINIYKILIGLFEGKKRVRRPRPRWRDNIKVNHGEMGCEFVDWIHLSQRPMSRSCEQSNEPSSIIKAGEYLHHLSNYQVLKKDPSLLCSSLCIIIYSGMFWKLS